MENKVWDLTKNEFIEMPKNINEFLIELKKLCKKYNLSISHEDYMGAFIIEKYDEDNINWINDAMINMEEK